MLWFTFLKVAKIHNLDELPVVSDPHHEHVKTCIFLYSMESFLYKKINEYSRKYDPQAIQTLGPFAVLLTRIVDIA